MGPKHCVDIVRHRNVVFRDTTYRMRNQRESYCSPTDIDVRMMIYLLGSLGHPAYGVDTGHKRRKLD